MQMSYTVLLYEIYINLLGMTCDPFWDKVCYPILFITKIFKILSTLLFANGNGYYSTRGIVPPRQSESNTIVSDRYAHLV